MVSLAANKYIITMMIINRLSRIRFPEGRMKLRTRERYKKNKGYLSFQTCTFSSPLTVSLTCND